MEVRADTKILDQSVGVRQPVADFVIQPNKQSFALTFTKT